MVRGTPIAPLAVVAAVMQISPEEPSMLVQYYPPHIPCEPATALEDTLRRAYPAPAVAPSDQLDGLLRRLMEQAQRGEGRLM